MRELIERMNVLLARGHLPLCITSASIHTAWDQHSSKGIVPFLNSMIMTKIRVLLIEDHPEVLKRIANSLEQESDILVVGKLHAGEEAMGKRQCEGR